MVNRMSSPILGIDTGGTFTDFVYLKQVGGEHQVQVHKVLSTPSAPDKAILQGIKEMGLAEQVKSGEMLIIHGTTVATNATLEGKGVRTAYITNKGLADVLIIGRQTREYLFDLTPTVPQARFESTLNFEIDARLDANGEVISALTEEALQQLKQDIDVLEPEAIAINLLFSYLDPTDEIKIENLFKADYFVSRSSFILPETNEYERGISTWVNSWIGPLINDYLNALETQLAPAQLAIMQSSGHTVASHLAAVRAVNLLLSGPAGGLAAAIHIGRSISQTNLMTFDMGGTSTDVALLEGKIKLTNEGKIAGFPISIPMADIHTIGAGGGSIVSIDSGGLLKVGPRSAGAKPGPACYGQGGTYPTVTDANLILGRISKTAFLGGRMKLDGDAARRAMAPLAAKLNLDIETLAEGVIRLANEHMTQALRVISIQQGYDPREFSLMCFGGAGGLHVCDLAETLEIPEAIVPQNSGILSAQGMVTSEPGRELVQTYRTLLANLNPIKLKRYISSLIEQARQELAAEGVTEVQYVASLDLRYYGQSHTLNIAYDSITSATNKFHAEHYKQYGHRTERDIELLNIRLSATGDQAPVILPSLPSSSASGTIYDGSNRRSNVEVGGLQTVNRRQLNVTDQLVGPLLILEDHATTYVKQGWRGIVDAKGNIRLKRAAESL
ncbi:MAG: N-methylhydantoinase A [Candidatus Azotimanducaceae bacterium]